MKKEIVMGYFDELKDLKEAIKSLRKDDIKINDVFTPFPVHGLDDMIGLKKSRIPTVGFIFGAIGAIGAFIFQAWIFTIDYPVNIGGKPQLSVPSFIPVIFEITVLFAAIAMVAAFLIKSRLGIGAVNKIYDKRITDDHFVVLLEVGGEQGADKLKEQLDKLGAKGITEAA